MAEQSKAQKEARHMQRNEFEQETNVSSSLVFTPHPMMSIAVGRRLIICGFLINNKTSTNNKRQLTCVPVFSLLSLMGIPLRPLTVFLPSCLRSIHAVDRSSLSFNWREILELVQNVVSFTADPDLELWTIPVEHVDSVLLTQILPCKQEFRIFNA